MRDGCVEPLGAEAYLNQYGEAPRGEPARLGASISQPSLSQRRVGGCSRSHRESCGLVEQATPFRQELKTLVRDFLGMRFQTLHQRPAA